jgi:diaminopimelate decarboxylase/aspartate kinase
MSQTASELGLNPGAPIVLKFGGTSVATRQRWETIASVSRSRVAEGFSPLVVCSALSGISNLLESIVVMAPDGAHHDAVAEFRKRHVELIAEMGLDIDAGSEEFIDEVARIAHGSSLLNDMSPRVRARLLSIGELLATHVGARFLNSIGVRAHWVDAREWMQALDSGGRFTQPQRHYLASPCVHELDTELVELLGSEAETVWVTQGFIGRDSAGDTVLLGRGGSDTSAAYFASKSGAARCEIWTDVPGMFTADPRFVANARHLRKINFDEAQEIATTGARVLHPRSIGPCRDAGIPMQIRSTVAPTMEGTWIVAADDTADAGIKAISVKRGITLVSMTTLGMWHQVGFLGDVFGVFKELALSIDLVSTSETSVTVSLDPGANAIDGRVLEQLREKLQPHCQAEIIAGCAAISLVGSRIRSMFARLAPAFALFEEPRVYMVTQAASDLNLSFVVDESEAPRLLQRLHETLFRGVKEGPLFGRTWQEMTEPMQAETMPVRWWVEQRERIESVTPGERPVYIYSAEEVRAAARSLMTLRNVDRVFYAIKANPNAHVLCALHEQGVGFECVSSGELARVFETLPDLSPERVLFTPNFASIQEYELAFSRGVFVNLDNLHPLQNHPDVFAGREVLVRVDPGEGRGHHQHVKTAGRSTKFGIDPTELPELRRLCSEHNVTVVGLHAHAGSGIRIADHWAQTATLLLNHADMFENVRFIDMGGGLGVVERNGQTELDLAHLDEQLGAVRQGRPGCELWLEPGRFLVARAGVLCARVTQTKTKGDVHYVGSTAGMHSLLRPALYGAHHEIYNLSRLGESPASDVHVVGPICESGDTLGIDRRMPLAHEGDVLLIDVVGAYGYSMASNYNLRGLPEEVWLDDE